MRYVGAVLLVLAALFGVGLISGEHANAATSGAPPPVVPPPGGGTLTQEPGGWETDFFLDTAALCGDKFDLVTGAPDMDEPARTVTYGAPAPCSAAAKAHPLTKVTLTFLLLPGGAIPQTASLVVTPTATALATGAAPVEFALTVRRQLTGASSLWFTVWFGIAFVVVLIGLVARFGAAGMEGRRSHWWQLEFWGKPLEAPSKRWTFGGSWARNFTALGTGIGGVLAATGTVAGIVPGVDLGRVGLLFAIAGVVALLAPLVFAALNSRFGSTQRASGRGQIATRRWILVAASSLTAFGAGAEIGLIGWVLGYHLSVAPLWVHWTVLIATFVVAVSFLAEAHSSICSMADYLGTTTTDGGQAAGHLAPATGTPSPP
jgi:hypothetical protein